MGLADDAEAIDGRDTVFVVVAGFVMVGATARDLAGLVLDSAAPVLAANDGRLLVEEASALDLSVAGWVAGLADRDALPAVEVALVAERFDKPLVTDFFSSAGVEVCAAS